MPTGPWNFDPDKAVEAILFTAANARTDLYDTLKLLYLADKLHLQRYGRFIFGDWYSAMEYGPVPSHAYDVVKYVRGDRPTSLAMHAKSAFRVDPQTHAISVLREPDLGELSATDIECLSEIIAKYGSIGFSALKKLSHDAAYEATPRNHQIALEAIAATLERSAELIQHVADPHPDRN